MAKAGKNYRNKSELVDREKKYPVTEAIKKLSEVCFAKFDETVDVALRLGVDPKHADQMVRGAVSMPNGTGKKTRILVFAKGDKIKEAQAAGADFVGGDDIVDKIKEGWMEFDTAIATPDMMAQVSKVGKILGPKGLMPNPKTGTVTVDLKRAVKEAKAGRVEYRVDKSGIIHAPIGKISFGAEKIGENFQALMDAVLKAKPSGAKGKYLRSLALSTTMSPSIRIDVSELEA